MDFKGMQQLLWGLNRRDRLIHGLQKNIDELKDERNALREYKSVQLTGMPHGQSQTDAIGAKVAKIDTIDQKLSEQLEAMEQYYAESKGLWALIFQSLTINEINVVVERYQNGYGWDFIPGRVNLSRRTCFRVHKQAIKKLIKAYGD